MQASLANAGAMCIRSCIRLDILCLRNEETSGQAVEVVMSIDVDVDLQCGFMQDGLLLRYREQTLGWTRELVVLITDQDRPSRYCATVPPPSSVCAFGNRFLFPLRTTSRTHISKRA